MQAIQHKTNFYKNLFGLNYAILFSNKLSIRYIFVLNFILVFNQTYSQQNKIDSLYSVIQQEANDTNKIIHLNSLSREYITAGIYDSALNSSNEALKIAVIIENSANASSIKKIIQKIKAVTFSNMGLVYWRQSDYQKALDYFFKSLAINETLGYKNKVAAANGNIGSIYLSQGNHIKALEYYLKVLKTFEELGDKNKTAVSLTGIGNIYAEQKQYNKALDYYDKALKLYNELNDENGKANLFLNIGVINYEQKKYSASLSYYLKALELTEKLADKNGMAYSLCNIGLLYAEQAKQTEHYNKIESDKLLKKALEYYFKSLKLNEELGNKNQIAIMLGNIGSVYMIQHKYMDAEKFLKQSLAIDTTIGVLLHIKEAYTFLSELYSKTGNYKLALENYQRAMETKDSLFNIEKDKDLTRKELNYEFDKKEVAIKAEQDKRTAVAFAESRKQKIIIVLAVLSLIFVIIFLVFVARSLRITKIQKQLIESQKEKVEIQNQEITKQKILVEEKNEEISDSISYAKRIQSSFLTSETYIKRLLPEYFILYSPKDIVSGDFYWMHVKDDYFYFCVGDCTGHGIPGAFMSLIGIGILNEIIFSKQLEETNEILDELRRIVILALNPEGATEEGKDGMDLVLGRFNINTRELQYSTAYNSFYVNRKGTITKYKGDKMPVGRFYDIETPFNKYTIQLEKGDIIYASTDGFYDQFGGPKGKKIMTKGFEQHLAAIGPKLLHEQKEILHQIFSEWKGNIEQIDDVTVVGIKI